MSDERWKDEGPTLTDFLIVAGSCGLGLFGHTATHIVRDTETGEERRLLVKPFQEVGDAIANGQWEDEDDEAEDEFEEDDEDDDEDWD